MRIGVLADIHSNVEALRAVLAACEQEGITDLVHCGDVVGYGPDPNECLELLEQRSTRGVRGNHDAAALRETELSLFDPAGRKALQWTQRKLSATGRAYLERLPLTERLQEVSPPVGLVHGSPADPLWGRIHRRRDAYLAFRVSEPDVPLLLFGHIHEPTLFRFDPESQAVKRIPLEEGSPVTLEFRQGQRYLLNPGSVGQPRDGDWRASFCILELDDSDTIRVQLQRLEYEVEKTREKILTVGLPEELGNRLLSGV